jgi:hypothetical protein
VDGYTETKLKLLRIVKTVYTTKQIKELQMSYSRACAEVAKWIAESRCENARDMEEDVTEWDNSSEEVIMLYLKEMASDIGKLVPAEIAMINDIDEEDEENA